jgi:hypothetical protein
MARDLLTGEQFLPWRFLMRALTVIAVALLPIPARADDKVDISKAEEQARAVGKAVLDGDFAKVADLTHPKIVEFMGGKDKMVEQTKAAMAKLKEQGITFKGYTIGKLGEPVIDGKTAYLVVPTTVEMAAPATKIEAESYLLGVTTDGGKTWTFVDGAGLANAEMKKKVFPTLPEGLTLPAPKPPKVTKN